MTTNTDAVNIPASPSEAEEPDAADNAGDPNPINMEHMMTMLAGMLDRMISELAVRCHLGQNSVGQPHR